MRYFIIAGLVVLSTTVACSDPAGPDLTEIVVTVEWPVAREPGFVDARWQLIQYGPDSPFLLGPRGPVVQSGVIGSTGMFKVRYSASCDEGEFGVTGHRIEVFGQFAGHEGRSLAECTTWAPHRCISIPKTASLQSNPTFEECRPPEG